jgi:copper chaperone CopZ
MKSRILILFLGIFSLPLHAQFLKAELEVSGLTCSMCSLSTQKSLSTLDFIGEIKPDLNKNIFYLNFKPGKEVNIDAIRGKVKSAGFSVSKLILVFHFNKSLKQSDFEFHGTSYHIEKYDQKDLIGDLRFQILDKDFISPKLYKSTLSLYNDPAMERGGKDKERKVYHILES